MKDNACNTLIQSPMVAQDLDLHAHLFLYVCLVQKMVTWPTKRHVLPSSRFSVLLELITYDAYDGRGEHPKLPLKQKILSNHQRRGRGLPGFDAGLRNQPSLGGGALPRTYQPHENASCHRWLACGPAGSPSASGRRNRAGEAGWAAYGHDSVFRFRMVSVFQPWALGMQNRLLLASQASSGHVPPLLDFRKHHLILLTSKVDQSWPSLFYQCVALHAFALFDLYRSTGPRVPRWVSWTFGPRWMLPSSLRSSPKLWRAPALPGACGVSTPRWSRGQPLGGQRVGVLGGWMGIL